MKESPICLVYDAGFSGRLPSWAYKNQGFNCLPLLCAGTCGCKGT
jgi:hypothetical protein